MNRTIQQSEKSNQSWVVPAAVIISTSFSVAESSASDFPYQPDLNRSDLAAEGTAWQNSPMLASSSSDGSFVAGSNAVPIAAEWHFELAKRIAFLASKPNGWKGPNSLAATKTAKELAVEFLRKLSVEQIDVQPKVGLDHEGTFSFFWSEDNLSVELTVYEDGTYSFFGASKNQTYIVDEAPLEEPLHNHLLSVLLA